MKGFFVPCPWPESGGTALRAAPPAGLSSLSFCFSRGLHSNTKKGPNQAANVCPRKRRPGPVLMEGAGGQAAGRAQASGWLPAQPKPAQKCLGAPPCSTRTHSAWELGGGLFSTQESCKSPEQTNLQLSSDLGGMSHCDTQPRVQILRGAQGLAQRTLRPQGTGPGEAAVQDRVLPSPQGARGASA